MKQILIAVDQLINTLTPVAGDGFGYADETLSARLFRCHLQGLITDRWYRAVDLLFFDARHCLESWRSEFSRAQYPSYYRPATPTRKDAP